MDSEFLERASERIVSSIMTQDVTEYCELLSPEVTLTIGYERLPNKELSTTASRVVTGMNNFGIETVHVFRWLLSIGCRTN